MTTEIAVPDLRGGRSLVDEAFETIRNGKGILSLDEFEDLCLLAGRVNGPALLHDAWMLRRIEQSTVTATISDIWSMAEYPDRTMPRHSWRRLFSVAGYTRDGHAAERPAEPVELWRGTVHERRRDWSWSTDRAVAEKFAYNGVYGRPIGTVFRVLAPPQSLLCENTERDESEFVVDTRGLRIVEAKSQ